MQGALVLIFVHPKIRPTVYRILRSTKSNIEYAHAWQDVRDKLRQRAYDLFILDYDHMPVECHQILNIVDEDEMLRYRALILSEKKSKAELLDLFSHRHLTNLIAKNVDITSQEMIITVEKILRGDIFGLEKYLTWGIEPQTEIVVRSKDKDRHLQNLQQFVKALGCSKRFLALANTSADEFLTNAIYNAPVDRNGSHVFAHLPRTASIELPPKAHVVFRYACDGSRLAMSVADNFGSLAPDTIRSYLAKCFARDAKQIDTKPGGAGMGFYYIFESLNQFVINIAAGRRTEVIGIIDIAGTYRDFMERPKSFNVFFKK